MALAFSLRKTFPPQRGIRERIVDVTADTDYPTGGWPVTAANFKLNAIIAIDFLSPTGGYVLAFDRANSKIMAYWGDNNNTSDGPLVEIPAGDNGIDTKVFPLRVTGS